MLLDDQVTQEGSQHNPTHTQKVGDCPGVLILPNKRNVLLHRERALKCIPETGVKLAWSWIFDIFTVNLSASFSPCVGNEREDNSNFFLIDI